MPVSSVSLALTGSGGAGVMTAGKVLLDALATAGWYGMMARSLGPQIRGGESAALLRLSTSPAQSPDDAYDIMVSLDWENLERFFGEIPLTENSLVICDAAKGDVPEAVTQTGAAVVQLPLQQLAKAIEGGRPNMIVLGVVMHLLGLEADVLMVVLRKILSKKGQEAIDASHAGILSGMEAAQGATSDVGERFVLSQPEQVSGVERWTITGNEACGLGVVRGGVRFAAAYPITPATEVLEWLAPNLDRIGGTLVQAEDELASINMCIGASFGGVPSVTATSGPGYSLMTESIGLAVASETPVVIVNVQRGGPSTGIPTKSEQADLNLVVYGLHGDAPHIVTAPTSIGDCLPTAQWTTFLAESLQTAAVVLTDQAMGQAQVIIDKLAPLSFVGRRKLKGDDVAEADYNRYAITADGVSPMAVPGMAGGQYVADGLEHAESGHPSTQAKHHQLQLDKRLRKLTEFNYGDMWADIEGDGETAVITFGSVTGQAREGVIRLREMGQAIRLIAVRLIFPVQPELMAEALSGVSKVLVVEQNHDGQFLKFLRAHYQLPEQVQGLHRPGPLAIRPVEVVNALNGEEV